MIFLNGNNGVFTYQFIVSERLSFNTRLKISTEVKILYIKHLMMSEKNSFLLSFSLPSFLPSFFPSLLYPFFLPPFLFPSLLSYYLPLSILAFLSFIYITTSVTLHMKYATSKRSNEVDYASCLAVFLGCNIDHISSISDYSCRDINRTLCQIFRWFYLYRDIAS